MYTCQNMRVFRDFSLNLKKQNQVTAFSLQNPHITQQSMLLFFWPELPREAAKHTWDPRQTLLTAVNGADAQRSEGVSSLYKMCLFKREILSDCLTERPH